MKGQKGASLVELLLATGLSLLVIASAAKFLASQLQGLVVQQAVSETQEEVQFGLDTIIRELRMAGYDPTGSANAGIEIAEAGRVRFSADLSGDGDVEDSSERVTYELRQPAGSSEWQLVRQPQGGAAEILAGQVGALVFQYILEDGSIVSTSDPSLVRQIQVTLTLLSASKNPLFNVAQNPSRQISGLASPRNLARNGS